VQSALLPTRLLSFFSSAGAFWLASSSACVSLAPDRFGLCLVSGGVPRPSLLQGGRRLPPPWRDRGVFL